MPRERRLNEDDAWKSRVMTSDNGDPPVYTDRSPHTIDGECRNISPCVEAGGERSRLVVFDFDNTLYGGDSGTQLVAWLLHQNWWRITVALLVSPVIAPLWLDPRARRRAISTYLWIGTVGGGDRGMTSVVDRYAPIKLGWSGSRISARGVDTLQMYRHSGDQVVVVTGAPFELVRTILGSALRDRVCVVGSTSRRFMGGLILDQHCYGAKKLALLCHAGYKSPIDIAFGDSTMDIPLLAEAAKPIVVNPRPRNIPAFRKALGTNVEIQHWSSAGSRQHGLTTRISMRLSCRYLIHRFSR